MDMQDKDFDKLFSQRFDDFEVKPSPAAWDNIVTRMDGRKVKRAAMPWLSIAAAVLVVATAGILFLNKADKAAASNQQVATQIIPAFRVKDSVEITKQTQTITQPKLVVAKTTVPVKQRQHKNTMVVNQAPIPNSKGAEQVINHEPVIDTRPVIASVTSPGAAKVQATLPDVELRPRTSTDVQTVIEVTTVTEPEQRRGIHNMGGLINALVAKIDKRETKLIEFSDDEDDDNGTKLSGINLGLIKIKKQ